MISDQEFWDSRYRNRDYIYGRVANKFFREQIQKNPPGKILCLCEGEGRNAVYAAYSGWEVVATDFSERAKEKAFSLAETKKVSIEYKLADIKDFEFPEGEFDYVALIHCHFSPEIKKKVFEGLIKSLKPGGGVIFEGFSKEQFGRPSGGPSDIDKLYSVQEIHTLLPDFDFKEMDQLEYRMSEGFYHIGMANIIRFLAFKKKT